MAAKTKGDEIAEAFAEDVRKAFSQVYGRPSRKDTLESILPTWSDRGVSLGWHDPDPRVVLVLTEYAWVQEPYSSPEDHELWEKVTQILSEKGWGHVGFESINPAVQIVFWMMPDRWWKILTDRAIEKSKDR